jgi:hypothetical protein
MLSGIARQEEDLRSDSRIPQEAANGVPWHPSQGERRHPSQGERRHPSQGGVHQGSYAFSVEWQVVPGKGESSERGFPKTKPDRPR